ncbi:MAG: hypothetical protein IPM61_14810 [Chlorobi bacterium]|nr:hypothetical protein [Chlorobiota bacterium]
MARLLCFIVCFIALFFASVALLPAQTGGITVTPPELYPGWNELTITAPGGVQEITSVITPNVELEGGGMYSCQNEVRLKVLVNTASETVTVNLNVRDCRGNVAAFPMRLNTTWNLDTIRFGRIEMGKTGCQLFRNLLEWNRWNWRIGDARFGDDPPPQRPHQAPNAASAEHPARVGIQV